MQKQQWLHHVFPHPLHYSYVLRVHYLQTKTDIEGNEEIRKVYLQAKLQFINKNLYC